MARLLRGLIPGGRVALLGVSSNSYDKVVTPGYEDLDEKAPGGFEGIRRVFMVTKYGELSGEITTISHMSSLSILGGAVFGSYLHGRKAWLDFMENNQATQFANHMDAKRKLQDTVLLAMGKGAAKWGWKIGGFSTLFIITNTLIAAYVGEPGLIEYVGAGAITGGLFKVNLGPRGFISGAIVGGFIGTLAGAASLLVLHLSGLTMKDIQQYQRELRKIRDDAGRDGMRKQFTEEYEILKMEADEHMRKFDNLSQENTQSIPTTKN